MGPAFVHAVDLGIVRVVATADKTGPMEGAIVLAKHPEEMSMGDAIRRFQVMQPQERPSPMGDHSRGSFDYYCLF